MKSLTSEKKTFEHELLICNSPPVMKSLNEKNNKNRRKFHAEGLTVR